MKVLLIFYCMSYHKNKCCILNPFLYSILLFFFFSSLRARILELKLKLEVYADIGADVRDKAELLVRERRLKLENERLLHQIKRLGNMERKEKLRYFETEAARNFAQKDAEIERLKKEAAVLKDTEASLMLDLDNTGSAHLESQVQNLTRQMQAQQCEKDAMTESLRLAQETIGVKTKENLYTYFTTSLFTTVFNYMSFYIQDVLTCPSCKVNRKDAILTKCFHVFCMKCLKTSLYIYNFLLKLFYFKNYRYDTRQRKCPKCNAGFGANDFHRLHSCSFCYRASCLLDVVFFLFRHPSGLQLISSDRMYTAF
uniref:E3 ubiquitin protein ligase n=1 Tax=Heterorhabditis bacteriophora TaxID=37862 RepID=A0A1I7X2Q8_HETBA